MNCFRWRKNQMLTTSIDGSTNIVKSQSRHSTGLYHHLYVPGQCQTCKIISPEKDLACLPWCQGSVHPASAVPASSRAVRLLKPFSKQRSKSHRALLTFFIVVVSYHNKVVGQTRHINNSGDFIPFKTISSPYEPTSLAIFSLHTQNGTRNPHSMT